MKKTSYFWILFWIVVNLSIFGWTTGFLQENILTEKITEQPIRALEEFNAEAVHLIKDAAPSPVATSRPVQLTPPGESAAQPK